MRAVFQNIYRRINQFFSQLVGFLPLNETEEAWVSDHLTPKEQAVFRRMSHRDQHHAVRVSMRLQSLTRADQIEQPKDAKSLIKAGLLHDIGRQKGDVSIIDKVIVVLVRRMAPPLAAALSRRGSVVYRLNDRTWWAHVCRAFYVQDVHPSIGARMAKEAGVEAEVQYLIRNHHAPVDDDRLLAIFSEADY